ncbi:MAG: hypothetical protein ACLTE2_08170 [Eubacteriales bacterium]
MDKNKNPRNGLNGQQALNTAVMPTKPTKRYIMVLVCSGETPNNGAMEKQCYHANGGCNRIWNGYRLNTGR